MGIHVVLYQPEIPANTGNVARTCLATNATLHLIHPLGFEISDKRLKRAGLDYWHDVNVKEYDSIDELFAAYETGVFCYIENSGSTKYYTEFNYSIDEEMFFIFGRETQGLPKELLQREEHMCLRVHMSKGVRSLNLSNTVAIVVYEALRQRGFPQME